MKYSENELIKIESIIEVYKEIVKDKKLTKVIGSFNKYFSCFSNFFTTLCSEKIINVDPYGNEYNLANLDLPDTSEVPYNEEAYTISIRLSHYNSLLTYIKTSELFNLEKLDQIKIDKIIKLLQFMDWDRLFDPQPIEVNTEALNKVCFYYKKDRGHQYILSSLKAATADMHKFSKDIINELEPIKLYFNEKYKLWVRKEILQLTKLPPELHGENIKKAHDIISTKIAEFNQPLFIELIGEILNEDFSANGEVIRANIVEKMIKGGEKPLPKPEKKIKKENPVEILEKSIAELIKWSSQTDTIIEKQYNNSVLMREELNSIFEKFVDYIKYNLLGMQRTTIYTIRIKDTPESKSKEKQIEFERFLSSIKQVNRKLIKYKDCDGEIYKNLISRGEKEILITLNQLLSKTRYIYKTLCSLDEYFKKNIQNSKGIQIELNVLLSSIDKAQTIYFEYKKIQSDDQNKTTYKPDINLTT